MRRVTGPMESAERRRVVADDNGDRVAIGQPSQAAGVDPDNTAERSAVLLWMVAAQGR